MLIYRFMHPFNRLFMVLGGLFFSWTLAGAGYGVWHHHIIPIILWGGLVLWEVAALIIILLVRSKN